MVYAIMTFSVFQSVAYPSMNALLSRRLKADEQGELQGGVGSLSSIAMIVGPLLLTQTLARFTEAGSPVHFPGAAFLLAAALACVALAILWQAMRRARSVKEGAIPAD